MEQDTVIKVPVVRIDTRAKFEDKNLVYDYGDICIELNTGRIKVCPGGSKYMDIEPINVTPAQLLIIINSFSKGNLKPWVPQNMYKAGETFLVAPKIFYVVEDYTSAIQDNFVADIVANLASGVISLIGGVPAPLKITLTKTVLNGIVSQQIFKDTDSNLKVVKVDLMSNCNAAAFTIGETDYTDETLVDVEIPMGTELIINDLTIVAGQNSATAVVTLNRI